jgi:DNA-binding LacI/PurR family transcriptional regulator
MARYTSSTDVARLAGVSQSAVSRAYTPGASVSAETRRKVLEAAEVLGYRPSLIPGIMLKHRSRLVAMVTENNRRARYYRLTTAGEKQLEREKEKWARASEAVNWVLGWAGGAA